MDNKFKKPTTFFIKSLKIYLALLILLVVFLGGFFAGVGTKDSISPYSIAAQVFNKTTSSPAGEDVDFDIFWQTWEIIQKQYLVRPVDERTLFYGALSGVAASLGDPYTVFFDPETTKAFNQEISGTFEGIGIEIGIKKENLVVIAPLPNSPAEKAGLLAGDKIIEIDDQSTLGITTDLAVSLIRGEKGTKVGLLIEREGEEKPIAFSITRELIKIQTVSWRMIEERFAYLQISHFNEDTEKEFQMAAREIILKAPLGVIIDLRNNPGGFLDTAINITSAFIPKGQVAVIEEFGTGKREEYKTDKEQLFQNLPVIVLVNGGSASASEIFAGALQDYEIATIVGEKTFGKGLVQELEKFSDGSSLKLSVAQWLTPKGRSIDQEGIEPDVIIELTQDDYDSNRDPQLEEALRFLREKTGS